MFLEQKGMNKLALSIALTSIVLGSCASQPNQTGAAAKNQSHMSQMSGGRICRSDRHVRSRIKKVQCDDGVARESRTSVACSGDALGCAKVSQRDDSQ